VCLQQAITMMYVTCERGTTATCLNGFTYNQLLGKEKKLKVQQKKNRKGGFEAIQFNSVYSIVGLGLARGYVYCAGILR